MASFLLTESQIFPSGTTLKVYLARSFPGAVPLPGQDPGVLAVQAVGVVSLAGNTTFEGLAADTGYVAGAQVAGVWKWVGFRTAPEPASSGGSGGLSKAEIEAIVTKALGEQASGQWPVYFGIPPARPTINGTIYYVSATGSDANEGKSEAKPFKTVKKALEQALTPGDGVLFKGGDTFAEGFAPSISGTKALRIVFGSYGHGNATLTGQIEPKPGPSYLTFDHLTIIPAVGNESAIAGWGNYIRIQNCNLTSELATAITAVSGLRKRGAHNEDYLTPAVGWEILFNFLHETGDSAILAGAAIEEAIHGSSEETEGRRTAEYPCEGFLVEGNIISHTGLNTALAYGKHGVYLKAKNSTVRRNVITDFSSGGVTQRYSNCTITENVFTNGPIAMSFFQYGAASTLGESHWTHNYIANCETGFYSPTEYISWNATGEAFKIPTAEAFDLKYNVVGPIWGDLEEFNNLKSTKVYDDGTNAYLDGNNDYSTFVGTNPRHRVLKGAGKSEGVTAVGFNALVEQREGSFNTAVGWKAAPALADTGGTVTKKLTLLGAGAALEATKGMSNTVAVGARAMQGAEEGPENVAVGALSLAGGAEGLKATMANCVAVGYKALGASTTGSNNVALGSEAGAKLTTGGSNTAVGTQALSTATTTTKNVAVGIQALAGASSSNNVAVGAFALSHAAGAGNVAVGQAAGELATSEGNVFVGFAAGPAVTSGEGNVFVGYKAGTANKTGSHNVYIGPEAGAAALGSNELIISSFGNVLISGNFSTPTLGFYKKAPVAQAAAIASPAETLAALKKCADELREAIKGIGITA